MSSETPVLQMELAHGYGPRVHILDNTHLLTLLSRLSSNDARQLELLALLRAVYQHLLMTATSAELPRVQYEVPTRMNGLHPREGVYRGPGIDPSTKVVVVDLIRAGIVPAQVCYELMNGVLPSENVRLDHLTMARRSDAEGRVTGVDLSGSKIGGKVDGNVLIVPDPMGATGSTTVRALQHYRERYGKPAKVIALPMISTPEYLRNVLSCCDEIVVWTARLDRGLSPAAVLREAPGTRWNEERGLNEHGYIVPGAGGLGELLNNSWC
jgi:uracil phosphoribosyltransferase